MAQGRKRKGKLGSTQTLTVEGGACWITKPQIKRSNCAARHILSIVCYA